jgi:hypothetical protein
LLLNPNTVLSVGLLPISRISSSMPVLLFSILTYLVMFVSFYSNKVTSSFKLVAVHDNASFS